MDIGTTALSAVGQIYGAFQGAKANRDQQRLIDEQRSENKAMYENNANKDFLDTNVAKDAETRMGNELDNARDHNSAVGAITGATDEAKLASDTATNDTYNKGLSSLASQGTQYQNQQEAIYRSQNALLNQQQSSMYKQQAQSAGNLGANSGELLGTLGTSLMGGKKNKASDSSTYTGD